MSERASIIIKYSVLRVDQEQINVQSEQKLSNMHNLESRNIIPTWNVDEAYRRKFRNRHKGESARDGRPLS